MKKVVIYSTRICPYCMRAKNFFEKKNITFDEIRIDQDPAQMQKMMEMSKRQSVPQIFIGDYHVGGFDDLIEHDMDGKLEGLLED
ncbi:MAG: glutaredoxin 3 [Pelagibacterales bacterium]|nr:glutaredoxin 3 [Pelagibacterales bacterium]